MHALTERHSFVPRRLTVAILRAARECCAQLLLLEDSIGLAWRLAWWPGVRSVQIREWCRVRQACLASIRVAGVVDRSFTAARSTGSPAGNARRLPEGTASRTIFFLFFIDETTLCLLELRRPSPVVNPCSIDMRALWPVDAVLTVQVLVASHDGTKQEQREEGIIITQQPHTAHTSTTTPRHAHGHTHTQGWCR